MDCCVNNLGSFPHNADINTGLFATQNGVYKIHLQYVGGIITKRITLSVNDPVIIERPFNESYLYKFTIEKPDRTLLSVDDCTNFSLKTYVDTSEPCEDSCETYT